MVWSMIKKCFGWKKETKVEAIEQEVEHKWNRTHTVKYQ